MSKIQSKLKHQPSKLDLIDDSTLTSLPFPPPPPTKRPQTITDSNDFFSYNDIRQRSISSSESTMNTTNTNTNTIDTNLSHHNNDNDEYYDEESQDQIVLIEDYINETSSPHVFKKKSFANFKQRISTRKDQDQDSTESKQNDIDEDEEISQSKDTTLNSIDEVTFSSIDYVPISSKQKENLEAIFGQIPASNLLKYCNLCDKPLYEVSSIISYNGVYNHEEFICSDCIENYERFYNIFNQSVKKRKLENKVKSDTKKNKDNTRLINEKLYNIFASISNKYNI